MRPIRTLYICYFGLREPLVQTQVLPYLHQLGSNGIEVWLLTFEPGLWRSWPAEELADWSARLQTDGIRWFALPYHKRFSLPATCYDILRGAWMAARLARRYDLDVLHARSHVPMMMALLAGRWTGSRLVFDLRGLMADEYVDAGIWKEDAIPFRLVKWVELVGLKRADQVVVLTERMRQWLIEQGLAGSDKVDVIPCCVDFARFDESLVAPATERFEIVYAGSVTGLYLLGEMGRFFLALKTRRRDAFLRILTASSATEAAETLQRAGVNRADFWIGQVRPAEVPGYLRRARLGLSFRRPTFSQLAASPTKIPEYLAASLPVVCNAGIGDTDGLIERERVGVVIRAFDGATYAGAAEQALALATDPETRARCARVARQHFDLARVGGVGYSNVYRRLKVINEDVTALSGVVS